MNQQQWHKNKHGLRGRDSTPNDRRLPKHNARRRKLPSKSKHDQPNSSITIIDEAEANDLLGTENDNHVQRLENLEETCNNQNVESSDSHDYTTSLSNLQNDNTIPTLNIVYPKTVATSNSISDDILIDDSDNLITVFPTNATTNKTQKCHDEIQHLLKRIQHNRQAFALSSHAYVSLDSYTSNVLNATRNCYNEWRSITKHYFASNSNNTDDFSDDNDDAHLMIKTTSEALFDLLQHALQTGPLAGAKPGAHFGRAGSEVAVAVLQLLEDLTCNVRVVSYTDVDDSNNNNQNDKDDDSNSVYSGSDSTTENDNDVPVSVVRYENPWYWTDKQAKTIYTWKRKAFNAAKRNKEPSQMVQTKQKLAKNKRKAKKL